MISALFVPPPSAQLTRSFILNQKGEVLISRLFRPDLKYVRAPQLPSPCGRSSHAQTLHLRHLSHPCHRLDHAANSAADHAGLDDLLPCPTRRALARRGHQDREPTASFERALILTAERQRRAGL